LQGKRIQRAAEIGTYFGVSAALLAYYTDHVITIDLGNYYDRIPFWFEFQVLDRITSFTVEDDAEKAKALTEIDFDFAYIDGDHTYDAVAFDFELTRRCGRVLFHDYYYPGSALSKRTNWGKVVPGIKKLVDSLPKTEVTIKEPFAYWEHPAWKSQQ
jgi:predicted O-methyltransferase YrrM